MSGTAVKHRLVGGPMNGLLMSIAGEPTVWPVDEQRPHPKTPGAKEPHKTHDYHRRDVCGAIVYAHSGMTDAMIVADLIKYYRPLFAADGR